MVKISRVCVAARSRDTALTLVCSAPGAALPSADTRSTPSWRSAVIGRRGGHDPVRTAELSRLLSTLYVAVPLPTSVPSDATVNCFVGARGAVVPQRARLQAFQNYRLSREHAVHREGHGTLRGAVLCAEDHQSALGSSARSGRAPELASDSSTPRTASPRLGLEERFGTRAAFERPTVHVGHKFGDVRGDVLTRPLRLPSLLSSSGGAPIAGRCCCSTISNTENEDGRTPLGTGESSSHIVTAHPLVGYTSGMLARLRHITRVRRLRA